MALPNPQSAIILECLARILASAIFQRAQRQSAFLRYVVEQTLAGDPDALKEYQIGLKVYERGPSYDTRTDPIVRVEASRLRAKLLEYYDSQGRGDAVRILLPKGTYVASFEWSEPQPEVSRPAAAPPPPQAGAAEDHSLADRRVWIGLGLVALLVGALLFLYWTRFRRARPAALMPRSVAVLPFRDFSSTSGDSEVADTLAEALSEELSRVEGLLVAGRTSTLRLREQTADLQVLGRRLNVGAVLEGSIQSSGRDVRVRARLIDVTTGFQLWSGTFDRSSVGIFAVQDEMARAIASTLRLQMGSRREPQEALTSPNRLAARDLFLKARQLHRRGDPALLMQAREIHLQAVKTDPAYPLAHSGLAHIDITIVSDGLKPAA